MEHHILKGALTLKRLLTELDLERPEQFEGRYEWLLDFRDAKFQASAEEVRQFGTFVKSYRQQHPTTKTYRMAAIAEDDVTYGLFRIFMVYADAENTMLYICRSDEEARRWLDSQNRDCA